MTYRELLNLYKNGELNAELENQVKTDIEKQEAISEYLFDNDDIPELTDTVFELEQTDNTDAEEKNFQKMIKKSIRKAFIKLGVVVGAVILALILIANTALPHIVDAFYYDPAKIVGTSENGVETNQLSLDTMVYTELFTPGYSRSNVIVDREGYGEYDIQILQNFSYDQHFENVFGTVEKNKLTLYNDSIFKKPTGNAFDTKAIENLTSTGGTGAAGDVASMLQQIASLDENDYYVAYVTLDKVMTYNEFLDWCNKTGISPDWCAICEKTDAGYYAEDIIGFNYNASSIEMGYNKEKYPNLNLFDITEDTESAMKTHTTSLLRYMADSKDFCNLFDENTSEEYLTRLADNIDKNGLNIYGFVVTAQIDTIMNICENTPYVYTKPLN